MAAVAWSAIGLLAATLAVLTTTCFGAISGLGGRIDKLGIRIDGLSNRIDAMGARLDARIDRLDARLDANTTELMRLSRRLDEHITRHAG